jgi:hypothetical protein
MALGVAHEAIVMLLLETGGAVMAGTHHQLPRQQPDGSVGDAELLAYSERPFDKAEMMLKTVVLGSHHGNKLVAECPCSDVCPAYTTRVIRYELKAGGGALREGA